MVQKQAAPQHKHAPGEAQLPHLPEPPVPLPAEPPLPVEPPVALPPLPLPPLPPLARPAPALLPAEPVTPPEPAFPAEPALPAAPTPEPPCATPPLAVPAKLDDPASDEPPPPEPACPATEGEPSSSSRGVDSSVAQLSAMLAAIPATAPRAATASALIPMQCRLRGNRSPAPPERQPRLRLTTNHTRDAELCNPPATGSRSGQVPCARALRKCELAVA